MGSRKGYRVKEVARLSGVSIRTLHHYDGIGLLVPSQRTGAGYRLYSDEDLLRLQQILIGRELGLPLEQIRRSLDDADFDRRKTLMQKRVQLVQNVEKSRRMIRAIDCALSAISDAQGERQMDMKDIFDGFDPAAAYEQETEARWGKSDSYQESVRRTKRYTEADWNMLGEEHASIYSDAVALMRSGAAADSEAAMDVAERHRLSIERWFYTCSHGMHSSLADGYETDARFAANIDKHGVGLTRFLVQAIRANAKRQEDRIDDGNAE